MVEHLARQSIHGDSLRILTTHTCQERCYFCHNEGSNDYRHSPIDIPETVDFAKKVRQEFGLEVAHLTGGEPTLHPQLIELITSLRDANLKVKMTSNGDFHPDLLNEIVSAGVESINFSLHAINAEDYRATQSTLVQNKSKEYYDFLVKRKKRNIDKARQLIKTKLNTIFITRQITGKVLDFAIEEKIPIRLMRNLDEVKKSNEILCNILEQRGLVPIKEQFATGDSGGSGIVYGYLNKPISPDVKVKKFGDVYLSSICDECNFKHTDKCRERFYGMRISMNLKTGENEVRLCIDKEGQEAVVSLEDIFKGKHYQALKDNYAPRKRK